MEKLEDFITRMAKVINESDKNQIFYEQEDDFTDYEDGDDTPIEDDDDPPSYDDVLVISKDKNNSEETMSKEEYDALSDEEKEEIHQAAKEIKAMSKDDRKDDDENLLNKWDKEFEPLRQQEKEKRNKRAEEKARKLGYTGDDFVDVKKTKHGVQLKDKKGEGGENAFMFICERVEQYGDKKKTGFKELVFNYDKNVQDWFVTNRDEVIQDMEVVEERTETIQGESVEELQEMMRERMKYFEEKYKIDLNEGWEIGSSSDSSDSSNDDEYNDDLEGFEDDEQGSDNTDKGKKKSKKDSNPVLEPPKEIRDIDEGAFGYMYYKITGDKKVLPPEYQGKRGRPPEGTWNTKLNAIILEYIIYTSDAVLKGNAFADMLQKKFGEN